MTDCKSQQLASLVKMLYPHRSQFMALIHHLAISNNVPLSNIAKLSSAMTRWLVIEFVPKADSQVLRLLATRKDIFENYTRQGFEDALLQYYTIEKTAPIPESERLLYLMKTR
ncbi:MAG: hypothetical protein P8J17_06245 [Halioglobus sp.]|nr:hypothetical protein [Halioglobus sp.]